MAIKLESVKCSEPQLQYEAKVYDKLKGLKGISPIHWVGLQGDYNAIVMEILGPTLQDLFEFCNFKFKAPTLSHLAYQMIS